MKKVKRIWSLTIAIAFLFSSIPFSAYGKSDEDTEELIRAANQGYSSGETNKTFQKLLYPVAEKNSAFSQNSSPVIYLSSDYVAPIYALAETEEDERGRFRRLYDWLKECHNKMKFPTEERELSEGVRKKKEKGLVAIIDVERPRALDEEKLWINIDEIPNDKIDNDNNEYVDDRHGWNFDRNSNNIINKFTPFNAHSAKCINGVLEVAPESKIMYLHIPQYMNLSALALGKTKEVILLNIDPAVVYATNNGAEIISISAGDSVYDPETQKAIDYAHSEGVIIVASAGNDNNNLSHYPAAYDNVIGVAGTFSGERWSSSNYGDFVDIAAPADLNTKEGILGIVYNPLFASYGTSISAPRVAGATASVWSEEPSLNATQITNILYNTADDIDPVGWDIYTGYGEVNLTAALQAVHSLENLNASQKDLLLNQSPPRN